MLIRYRKDDLLKKIEENRDKHLQEFEADKKLYLREVEAWLHQKLNSIEKEDFDSLSLHFYLPKPVSHFEEYDIIIKFLKGTPINSVEITLSDYKRFVLNIWDRVLEAPFLPPVLELGNAITRE